MCECEQPGGCAGTGWCHQAPAGAGCEVRELERELADSHLEHYHWLIASESDVGIRRPHAAETNKKVSP